MVLIAAARHGFLKALIKVVQKSFLPVRAIENSKLKFLSKLTMLSVIKVEDIRFSGMIIVHAVLRLLHELCKISK